MTDADIKPRNLALSPGGLRATAAAQYQYTAMIDASHTLDDLIDEKYWQHNAGARLLPHTEIRCYWEDNSRYAILLVIDCGPNWAKVVVLEDYDLQDTADAAVDARAADDSEYFVKWGATVDKWCVYRKSDNVKVKKGYASKEEAEEARVELIKTLAR